MKEFQSDNKDDLESIIVTEKKYLRGYDVVKSFGFVECKIGSWVKTNTFIA